MEAMSSAVPDTLPARPVRRPARDPWAWLLAMAGCAGLLLAVFTVFVTTSTGQLAEFMALEAATHRLASLHGSVTVVLDFLPQIVGVIGVAVFGVLTVWRRRWFASLVAAAGFAGANLTTQVLKNVVLVRPELDNGVPYYTGNSLPSGHTTFATAAALAVFLMVAPRWRPVTAAVGALFATAVGAGTFVEAWHRPADMAAAYLVAAFWALTAGWVILRTGPDWNTAGRVSARFPHPAGRPGWDVALWAGGILAVAGAWLAFLAAGGVAVLDPDPAWHSGWHFLAGLLFSVGPGLLVFGFLATFFRWQSGRR
jgi:membrane-associated phospholipid phosphatase